MAHNPFQRVSLPSPALSAQEPGQVDHLQRPPVSMLGVATSRRAVRLHLRDELSALLNSGKIAQYPGTPEQQILAAMDDVMGAIGLSRSFQLPLASGTSVTNYPPEAMPPIVGPGGPGVGPGGPGVGPGGPGVGPGGPPIFDVDIYDKMVSQWSFVNDLREAATARQVGYVTNVHDIQACPGDPITIEGEEFDEGDFVLFPCREGWKPMARANLTWTNNSITLKVPPNPRKGFIAVFKSPDRLAVTAYYAALDDLKRSDPLNSVFRDPFAPKVRSQQRESSDAIFELRDIGRTFYYDVAEPSIVAFLINGERHLKGRPGQRARLSWRLADCEAARVASSGDAPEVVLPDTPPSGTEWHYIEVDLPRKDAAAGVFTLETIDVCGTSLSETVTFELQDKVGLVLGGGAGHGDFQLGVLRYLFEETDIRPDVIAGTSVGSLAALQLAHAAPVNMRDAFQTLQTIWYERIRTERDFIVPTPFANLLGAVLENIDSMMAQLKSNQEASVAGALISSVAGVDPILHAIGTAVSSYGVSAQAALLDTLKRLIDVISATITGEPLATGVNPFATDGLFTMANMRALVDDFVDPKSVARSGVELRLVAVGLDTLDLVVVDEGGLIWRSNDGGALVQAGQNDRATLTDGAIASSSMPVVMTTVPLNGTPCTDAGIRENVPVKVAARDCGATKIYAVATGARARSIPYKVGGRMPAMWEVLTRSLIDATLEEVVDDDMDPWSGWGNAEVVTFRPKIDVHDSFGLDPGLIRIAADYGWLVASDTLNPPDRSRATRDAAADTAAEIVSLRATIWELENIATGRPYLNPARGMFDQLGDILRRSTILPLFVGATDPAAVARSIARTMEVTLGQPAWDLYREKKRRVAALVLEREARGLSHPGNVDDWWLRWEFHMKPAQLAETEHDWPGFLVASDPWGTYLGCRNGLPVTVPAAVPPSR